MIDLEKLAKILAQTGGNSPDPVKLTACNKANQMLKEAGMTWEAVLVPHNPFAAFRAGPMRSGPVAPFRPGTASNPFDPAGPLGSILRDIAREFGTGFAESVQQTAGVPLRPRRRRNPS